MRYWAPLWNMILESSIWEEDYAVRCLWVALLVLQDPDHVVRLTAYQISRRANMKLEDVESGLSQLAGPDRRRLWQENEGRRIEAVDEGYLILNGEKYQELMLLEMKRARNRRSQARHRQKQKLKLDHPLSGVPLPGETEYVKSVERGDDTNAS